MLYKFYKNISSIQTLKDIGLGDLVTLIANNTRDFNSTMNRKKILLSE